MGTSRQSTSQSSSHLVMPGLCRAGPSLSRSRRRLFARSPFLGAKGSCSLMAEELPARSYNVYANYAGNTNFVLSTSWRTKTVLSIARASTKTSLQAVGLQGHLRPRAGRAALGQRRSSVQGRHADRHRHDQWHRLSNQAVSRQRHLHSKGRDLPCRKPQSYRPLLG